ncbi:hypothetical protein ACE3NQ_24960 [Paenibacillus terreus]|uniref:Uncharacterized protein n=1 Tax=Paenibacillus terreus TaxID=1387834 RepID=A0ABV5BEY3_9BACL
MCAQRQKRRYTDIVDLYSKFEPTLRAGLYQLEFNQQIFDPSGILLDDLTARGEKDFVVSGPQFSLQPADLGNSYPPPGHPGLFENVLPYIQLNNPHLPWIRKLDASKIPDSDNLPWLSLLVLQENEWQGEGIPTTASIAEFLTNSREIAVPNIDIQQIEDTTQSCKYLEMSVGTFRTHFSKVDDLRWIVSARVQPGTAQGRAIITARRFPIISDPQIPQQKYACYLVSLEGLEDFLMPTTTRSESIIRLACLHHWTFTTINQTGESFRDLLKNMLNNTIAHPDDIWLRLPRSLIEQIPDGDRKRLLDGYIPLNYHTRSGEETLTWYRGPFIPVSKTLEKPVGKPHYTSNELLIYDPDKGVLDTTWSVSSEIGKALALQDSNFIKDLLQARKWWVRSLDKASAFEGHSIDQQLNQRILDWSKLVDRALSFNTDTVVPTEERPAWRRNRLLSRPDPIDRLRRAANDGELIRSIQGKPSFYDNGTTWATNAVNFSDIPMMYLIPNEHMLPMEAIRLFHVDPTWIEAMFDGVFSIGIQTDLDEIINQYIRWDYTANIDTPVFGVILRSALVSGWPDVHVEGWRQGRKLNVLSDDRRENILFCLFDEVPDMITITEDQDDLTYGMNTDYTIELRHVTSSEFGNIIANGETCIRGFISPSGQIDISALHVHLQSRISDLTGSNIELNPVSFMLQLINGADRGVINIS